PLAAARTGWDVARLRPRARDAPAADAKALVAAACLDPGVDRRLDRRDARAEGRWSRRRGARSALPGDVPGAGAVRSREPLGADARPSLGAPGAPRQRRRSAPQA